LELRINGEVRQHSNTRNLIFDVPKLIELASSFYTLHPGDIIMTGTPDGVGRVAPGDRIEARIQTIGSMEVAVRAAA
jgi:2-keto-4-pentenoate hydratase/2-oxohepta-3-ene-1,7-dioic acid hydratase in catechol pathway